MERQTQVVCWEVYLVSYLDWHGISSHPGNLRSHPPKMEHRHKRERLSVRQRCRAVPNPGQEGKSMPSGATGSVWSSSREVMGQETGPSPMRSARRSVRSGTTCRRRKKDMPFSGGFSNNLVRMAPEKREAPLLLGDRCWMCDYPLGK